MRKYLLLLIILFSAAGLRAQRAEKRSDVPVGAGRFEGEVAAGVVFGALPLKGYYRNSVGPSLGIECRYNFPKTPFDVGLRLNAAFFNRWGGGCTPDIFPSLGLLAVADYNLQIVRGLVLFAGVGAGGLLITWTAKDIESDVWIPPSVGVRLAAMPRVGFECWNRLRLTLGYMYTERANRHFSATLGIAIGGGRRGFYSSGKP